MKTIASIELKLTVVVLLVFLSISHNDWEQALMLRG